MSLKHCIIHHIERAVPGAEVITTLREQENNCSGAAYSLFEQLKQSYQRSSQKQYGHFDREQTDNPVPGWLLEHLQGKTPFARNSQRLLEHLQQKMGANDEAFSAHIMIALETVMEQDQLYIFWINHVDANVIDSNMDVGAARYIDSSKMQFGIRLFVEEWQEQDSQKYLSIITSRGNKNLSDGFEGFIGFSSGIDIVEETSEFLHIVDEYASSLPSDKVSEYKGKILDYCVAQDKQGSPVVFEDISSELNEQEPSAFAQFVTTNQQSPKSEIYTDRSSLKRYVRFFGRDKNMSISFSADMMGQDIIFDEASGTLTLKQIPKSLRQQLKQSKNAPIPTNSAANTPKTETENSAE
ncbi:nucleoid-associated protein [Oceanicoccus sp. KOV_DT_Chl]|uniref:nucleoid-associated protein n=1 Tax=Oceanicoccus sp. KOV_DT_Chl TaxID=1904639 RepID=UPI000C7AADC1|nr:nucleoid-associated protein [Oceanicoccus sp. KOV_DT_Chl]